MLSLTAKNESTQPRDEKILTERVERAERGSASQVSAAGEWFRQLGTPYRKCIPSPQEDSGLLIVVSSCSRVTLSPGYF